jgi:hypothetical protein
MARRFLLISLVLLFESTAFAQNGPPPDKKSGGPQVSYPLEFVVTPPTRNLPRRPHEPGEPKETIRHGRFNRGAGNVADPVVQTVTPTVAAAQGLNQFEALGEGYPGFSVTAVPPDPNIAVGPNHIVQWVNGGFVVFDKSGAQVQAPIDDQTFWGLTSTCTQLGGFSDPIVQYDRAADRWVIGEVAIPLLPGLIGQYAQCLAVSTTPDPTGPYFMWAYGFGSNINDYPKISVWPDGYYVTWNIFASSGSFAGPEACAFNRTAMLGGAAAPALVCFKLSSAYSSLLTSDLDGATAPPAGSPNFVMSVDPASNALNVWKFHVDFANTQNSTFVGPISIAGVAPFTSPCLTTQDCIPQPGTTTMLDAIGDRLMYRLAYRNFGDHESLVANHTVLAPGGNTAVRWYEVRNPAGTPTIFQQGTFAPDSDNRWMASIGMDQSGNIGIGYSVASGVTYPSIRYTGWEVGDTAGQLQTETFAVVGGGSQTGYDRWGDYSAMRIDPIDDCTFWYTQEYQATTQSANWNSRIMAFKFPSCGSSRASTTTTLASSANPSTSGQGVTFTATVSPAAATGTVAFFDGTNSLGTAPLIGSTASLSTAALSVGNHSITAVYSGDSTYASSTSAVLTQTVSTGSVSTTTTLSSSVNPSVVGQSVTFTASVTPSSGTSTPTGTITFLDGATVIGSSGLDASGSAAFTTSTLSVGPHSITAQYTGDATFAASSSTALSQTVNKVNTTTTVTSNRNPARLQQLITFRATVSPSAATGTVQFFDGTRLLGTSTLNSSGIASLAVVAQTVGTHQITAQYSGDSKYSGSTSAVLMQVVQRR